MNFSLKQIMLGNEVFGLTLSKFAYSLIILVQRRKMSVIIDEFRKEVYEIVSSIPRGRVLSYGQIAWLIGYPRHARLVGKMLRDATGTEALPCHRVVNSSGRMAPCWPEQRRLLEKEGITFRSNGSVDMKRWQWRLEE